jgi:hypothetical protein
MKRCLRKATKTQRPEDKVRESVVFTEAGQSLRKTLYRSPAERIYVKVAEDMAEYVEKMAALYGVKPGDVRAAMMMAVSAANFSER